MLTYSPGRTKFNHKTTNYRDSKAKIIHGIESLTTKVQVLHYKKSQTFDRALFIRVLGGPKYKTPRHSGASSELMHHLSINSDNAEHGRSVKQQHR